MRALPWLLLLAAVVPAWAEQTVCYAFERNFFAECGSCPAGSEYVSGPNKPVAACVAQPLRDPRLISQEEGMARIAGSAGKPSRKSGLTVRRTFDLSPPRKPAWPAAAPAAPAADEVAPPAAPAAPPSPNWR